MKTSVDSGLIAFFAVAAFAVAGTFVVIGQTGYALLTLAGCAGAIALYLLLWAAHLAWANLPVRSHLPWRKPVSFTDRLRKLHAKELTGPCPNCGARDADRRMMEGGWDGSQIASCSCGHRWVLDKGMDKYLDCAGPATNGRTGLSLLQQAMLNGLR